MFAETFGHDLDVYQVIATGIITDSGYYPIWTFGIQNTGSEDDNFTMSVVYFPALGGREEFDITKRVPAGKIVLFRTPTLPSDSSAIYTYPERTNPADTNLPLNRDYYGFLQQSPDSTEIHFMRPSITISYGVIDNGPEACNTPASTFSLNIDRLPKR